MIAKSLFILRDELVVEKCRTTQEQVNLTLPEHLDCAQKVFGTSVGLGVRVFVPYQTRRSTGRVSSSHVISKTDTINVVPSNPKSRSWFAEELYLGSFPS